MSAQKIMGVLPRAYGAFGVGPASPRARSAFAGERLESDTGWYLLGGRPYSPALRRFLAPDTASPFDEGGVNRHAYCGGDPVNRIDPTGESWTDWILPVVSVAFAAAAAVASGGVLIAAIPATGAAVTPAIVAASGAAVADAVGLAAAIGSTVTLATRDAKLNGIFGWVSLGSGLISGVALPMAVKQGASVGSRLGDVSSKVAASAAKRSARAVERTSGKAVAQAGLRSARAGADIARQSGLSGSGARRATSPASATSRRQTLPFAQPRRTRGEIPDDVRRTLQGSGTANPSPERTDPRRDSMPANWRYRNRTEPSAGTRNSTQERNAATSEPEQESLAGIGSRFTGVATGMVDEVLLTALNGPGSARDDGQRPPRPSP